MLEDLKLVFSDVKEKMLGSITTAYSSMVQSLKQSYKDIKIAIQNGLIKTYNAIIKILPESIRPQSLGYVGEAAQNPNLRAGAGSGGGLGGFGKASVEAGEFAGLDPSYDEAGITTAGQLQAEEFSSLVPVSPTMQASAGGAVNPNLRSGTSEVASTTALAASPDSIVKALEETNRLFGQLIALSDKVAKNTKETSMNLKKTANVMEG